MQDLQQCKIAAVDSEAFGGYLLVAHLLQQNGVPSNRYQTQFVSYPIERTLHALASGSVDAAIAPLCLMEEMAQQGKINKKQYRLIHPVATASSCQSSTKIYPNWTLAATEQAPAALIRQINQNLFGLSQYGKSQPEQESLGIGQRWLPAESSSDAERILYDMNRHPAQKQLGAHMVDWVKVHRLMKPNGSRLLSVIFGAGQGARSRTTFKWTSPPPMSSVYCYLVKKPQVLAFG